MRILVTGVCGNLGRALVRRCRGRHDVVGLDVIDPPADIAGAKHLQFHKGNAFDEAFFRQTARGCDAICHTAALHGGHVKSHTLAQFIQTNVIGMDMICRAMLDLSIQRMAFSSTSEITLGTNWNASGATVITDQTPPCPDSIYSLSKLLAEQVAWYYVKHKGLRIACLRYCAFGGTSGKALGTNLICRYLNPEDVAEANLRCIESDNFDFEVFYVAPVSPLINHDMPQAAADPEKVVEKYWPGAVGLLKSAGLGVGGLWPKLDVTRLQQVTGWRPGYTFDDLVAELKCEKGI